MSEWLTWLERYRVSDNPRVDLSKPDWRDDESGECEKCKQHMFYCKACPVKVKMCEYCCRKGVCAYCKMHVPRCKSKSIQRKNTFFGFYKGVEKTIYFHKDCFVKLKETQRKEKYDRFGCGFYGHEQENKCT
jgi:hypothetical protein